MDCEIISMIVPLCVFCGFGLICLILMFLCGKEESEWRRKNREFMLKVAEFEFEQDKKKRSRQG